MKTECPECGSEESEHVADFQAEPEELVKCADCDLQYSKPVGGANERR